LKKFLVRGRYGPGLYVEHVLRAKTPATALTRGILLLRKSAYWDMMGAHKVFVEEVSSDVPVTGTAGRGESP
jgi:hypothetical protein